MGFASANAGTAAFFASIRSSICGPGKSGQRMCRPPGGGTKFAGFTNCRAGGSCTDIADSTVSDIALKPTHMPEKRDNAIPYRPYSRYSATFAGFRLGMNQARKATSDWCGIDDETHP